MKCAFIKSKNFIPPLLNWTLERGNGGENGQWFRFQWFGSSLMFLCNGRSEAISL